MKVGDLVKLVTRKGRRGRYSHLVGLVVNLPNYDFVVEVMWSDGQRGHINKECLEVVNEDRE
mgnify:FL=1